MESPQKSQQNNILLFLRRVWDKLDGWKSTIGLALLYIDNSVDLPNTWEMETIKILLYMWTGVGLTHKVMKQRKASNADK